MNPVPLPPPIRTLPRPQTRRHVLLLTAASLTIAGLTTGSLTAQAAAAPLAEPQPGSASARIGQRLRAALPAADQTRLRAHLPADPRDLARRIAADHRAGRVVALQGLHLSWTEAAHCFAAAEAAAMMGMTQAPQTGPRGRARA